MSEWENFQKDVLDVLEQYKGYFDFFERIGNLGEHKRPDCLAKVARENKKEVWIIDVKNKKGISEEDKNRMKNYSQSINRNLVDVGLSLKEAEKYEFRKIIITPHKESEIQKYEVVSSNELHQFLQKELIYSNSEKVARDLAKMLRKKQLSQKEARLIYRSVQPFKHRIESLNKELEDVEQSFGFLNVEQLHSSSDKLPVDVKITHKNHSDKLFLLDIPYREKDLDQLENKVEQLKNLVSDNYNQVYYGLINDFETENMGDYSVHPENLKDEISDKFGIFSYSELEDLFKPKFETKTEYHSNRIVCKGEIDRKFVLEIENVKDSEFVLKIHLNPDIIQKVKNHNINSRSKLFEFRENFLYQELSTTEDGKLNVNGVKMDKSEYYEKIRSNFQVPVNRSLMSKQVSKRKR